jgi:hypothetical protein
MIRLIPYRRGIEGGARAINRVAMAPLLLYWGSRR